MTRPGIEPRSPGPLANTLTAGPMSSSWTQDSFATKTSDNSTRFLPKDISDIGLFFIWPNRVFFIKNVPSLIRWARCGIFAANFFFYCQLLKRFCSIVVTEDFMIVSRWKYPSAKWFASYRFHFTSLFALFLSFIICILRRFLLFVSDTCEDSEALRI